MARLNIDELIGGLLEAAMVAKRLAERQHINNLSNYFDDDGNAKTTKFKVGTRDVEVPLYILADHSSIGLDELDVEFDARLIVGDHTPSTIKKDLFGLLKRKSTEEVHHIRSIEVDSGKNENTNGMAKIKIKFKSDEKPEMVSRLIDSYIQNIDHKDPK